MIGKVATIGEHESEVCMCLVQIMLAANKSHSHWYDHTCTHNPFAIFADLHTLTGLLELKVLQQLNAVRILWVVLQTALAASCQPFGQRSGCVGARDGINWYLGLI